jgi:hypothetical protein
MIPKTKISVSGSQVHPLVTNGVSKISPTWLTLSFGEVIAGLIMFKSINLFVGLTYSKPTNFTNCFSSENQIQFNAKMA